MYVCHRCWLKWNLISWWQCVTTNTSSLSTCPWRLGAPSYSGCKVRLRYRTRPASYHTCNHWLALTWPQPFTDPRSDVHPPHRSPSINLITLYLLNGFIQHLWHYVSYNHQSKANNSVLWKCCMDCLQFYPQFLYFHPPTPLCFVFCLWSDFITYATELFGPVGRWCPPHHTAHQRRTQTTCTNSPSCQLSFFLKGHPFAPIHSHSLSAMPMLGQ